MAVKTPHIPYLLYSYLAAEVLAPFFASFVILSGVMLLGRLVPFLDMILGYGVGLVDFLRLYSYVAPQLFLFSLPMASMMASIIACTRLANSGEITAMKACGMNLYAMTPPFVLFSLFTAGLTWYTATTLIPAGHMAMQQHFIQMAKEKIDKGVPVKRFSEGMGGVVLYVDNHDDAGRWRGIYVSDTRDAAASMTIIAQSGQLRADVEKMAITLTLLDGSIHRAEKVFDQTVRFKEYVLFLPVQMPEKFTQTSSQKLDKKGLTQQELLTHAKLQGMETEKGRGFQLEYHQRMALPVGCLVLTLLGIPLGLTATPGRRSVGIPLGLGLFLLYYILLSAAKSFGETGKIPIGLGIWTPNLLFALLAVHLLRGSAREAALLSLPDLKDDLAALVAAGKIRLGRIFALPRRRPQPAETLAVAAMDHVRFDLHTLLADTTKTFIARAEEREIELTLVQDANIPRFITGNPDRLRAVMREQIEKALMFSTRGGIIVNVSMVDQEHPAAPATLRVPKEQPIFAEPVALMFSVEYTGISLPESAETGMQDTPAGGIAGAAADAPDAGTIASIKKGKSP